MIVFCDCASDRGPRVKIAKIVKIVMYQELAILTIFRFLSQKRGCGTRVKIAMRFGWRSLVFEPKTRFRRQCRGAPGGLRGPVQYPSPILKMVTFSKLGLWPGAHGQDRHVFLPTIRSKV